MRIIARRTLATYWSEHPETRASLSRWLTVVKAAKWASMNEIQSAFPKARVLDADRVRFAVAGGNYRMIVAFDLGRQIAFIKFIGTHKECDAINPLTVSSF